MFLNGLEIPTPGRHGEEIIDDSFLVLFNAGAEDRGFVLPPRRFGARWVLELSTAEPSQPAGSAAFGPRADPMVRAQSVVVFKRASA
jgi:glycogen operon protein